MYPFIDNIAIMGRQRRILIAEDEAGIRDFVCRGLTDCGFEAVAATDGEEAWRLLQTDGRDVQPTGGFDLVMLDIRMPGLSGLEVCRRLRQQQGYRTPVLMLTALGTTDDIVMGLHAGADDYVVKPFRFMELLARIEALLRRVEAMHSAVGSPVYADLRLDPVSHKAVRGGVTVELSTKEFRLLEYFISHAGEVLSRRQLLRDVWDKDFDTNTNVVDVYVRYLRTKIDEPFPERLIHTIVGVGYVFKSEE